MQIGGRTMKRRTFTAWLSRRMANQRVPHHRLEGFSRDLRYALRSLPREPTFVAGVVLPFALAIGMNAAMFGLVTRLMLSPPPGIRDADRVARIGLSFLDDDGNSFAMSTTSYPVF